MSARQQTQKQKPKPTPKPEPDSPTVNPDLAKKWFTGEQS